MLLNTFADKLKSRLQKNESNNKTQNFHISAKSAKLTMMEMMKMCYLWSQSACCPINLNASTANIYCDCRRWWQTINYGQRWCISCLVIRPISTIDRNKHKIWKTLSKQTNRAKVRRLAILTSFNFNVVIWLWLKSSSVICLLCDKIAPSNSDNALFDKFSRSNKLVDFKKSIRPQKERNKHVLNSKNEYDKTFWWKKTLAKKWNRTTTTTVNRYLNLIVQSNYLQLKLPSNCSSTWTDCLRYFQWSYYLN